MSGQTAEFIKLVAISTGTLLLVGYLFYNNILAGFVFFPYLFINVRKGLKKYEKKRREKLAAQFRDAMQSVVSALQSGYSIENAFREAVSELELLYGKKTEIYAGFSKITHRLNLNVPISEAFGEFAGTYDVEEINNFSEILSYAKVSGGNMVDIIKNTTDTISGKIEVKREITTIISSKKLESGIMNLVPMAIILYMRLTSADMFDKLYGNAFGIFLMTVCLLIYYAAVVLSERITDIKV